MYIGIQNYREILREALNERQQLNPLYSMTAFARDLGVSAGMLSLVLRGQRGLSIQVAQKAASVLRMNAEEREYFLSLVESAHARSPSARKRALEVMQKYDADEQVRSLQMDAFRVISDWYHFGIIELMKLSGFVDDPVWIAEHLGITPAMATDALKRLCHLELVELRDGRHVIVQDSIFTTEGIPSNAIRKFHRQVMEKAMLALTEQPIDERYVNSTILAIDEKDLPVARQKIKDLHLDLMKTLGATPSPNRVYAVSVQLFAVSQKSVNSGNPLLEKEINHTSTPNPQENPHE